MLAIAAVGLCRLMHFQEADRIRHYSWDKQDHEQDLPF
jgi:hypothetical protein